MNQPQKSNTSVRKLRFLCKFLVLAVADCFHEIIHDVLSPFNSSSRKHGSKVQLFHSC